jgi:hypothetical protein
MFGIVVLLAPTTLVVPSAQIVSASSAEPDAPAADAPAEAKTEGDAVKETDAKTEADAKKEKGEKKETDAKKEKGEEKGKRAKQEDDDEEKAQKSTQTTGDAFGEEPPDTAFNFRMLLQLRYQHTWAFENYSGAGATRVIDGGAATAAKNDGWRVHRAFFRIAAKPMKQLRARLLLDFAELLHDNEDNTLKSAYVEVRPLKRFEVTVGLFERPFSLLELLPTAEYELANDGPTNRFIKDNGYAGRDVGVMLRVSPLKKRRYLSAYAGAFAGDPELGYDASPVKLLAARVESTPHELPGGFIRVGADVAWRTDETLDRPRHTNYEAVTVLDDGAAVSADVSVRAHGVELRVEGLYGDRTDYLWRSGSALPFDPRFDSPPDEKQFLAGWAVLTARAPIGKYALIPALRAERLDTDLELRGEARWYLSAALSFELNQYLRLLADLSRYIVEDRSRALDDRPWPALSPNASGPNENFLDHRPLDVNWTQFVLQLQAKI